VCYRTDGKFTNRHRRASADMRNRKSSYEERPAMKKFTFTPALLLALSAPIFTASVFAIPVNQQSAWDIKQPLSQNFAQTVSIGSRFEDEMQRGSGLAGNVDLFPFYKDLLLSRHQGGHAQIHNAEFQKLLSAVRAGSASRAMQVSRASDLVVDVSVNSLATDTGITAIAAPSVPATSVPEPGSLALLAAGMTGIMVMRRRAK